MGGPLKKKKLSQNVLCFSFSGKTFKLPTLEHRRCGHFCLQACSNFLLLTLAVAPASSPSKNVDWSGHYTTEWKWFIFIFSRGICEIPDFRSHQFQPNVFFENPNVQRLPRCSGPFADTHTPAVMIGNTGDVTSAGTQCSESWLSWELWTEINLITLVGSSSWGNAVHGIFLKLDFIMVFCLFVLTSFRSVLLNAICQDHLDANSLNEARKIFGTAECVH